MKKLMPALLVILLLLSCAVAQAREGKIAYECSGDIWVVDLDGGTHTRLTSDGTSHNPVWSPDGAMISYGSEYKLLFMNADGSGNRGIPLDAQTFGSPCWVPGEHEILVHMLKERAICATPLSGKPYCRVVAKGKPCAFHPCLSPDKTFIVYYSGSSEGGKVVRAPYSPDREPSLSDVRELTRYDSFMPALSRDGKKIAFCQGGTLWIMSADGKGHQEVPKSKGLSCRDPVWSPDGKKLAFVSEERQPSADSQGCRRIKIMDLQSGTVKTISPGSHTWCSTPSWTP